MRLRDSKLVGFIIGFSAVTLIGGLLLGGWVSSKRYPTPTMVPSAIPLAARATESSPGQRERVTSSSASAAPAQLVVTSTATPQREAPISTPSRTEPVEYVVQPGDTLFDVALAYGVSVEAIQQANDLQGETIQPSQTLLIPMDSPPTPTHYREADLLVHTVVSGETLSGIAERYSLTVEEIQKANDLNSSVIQPGWQLRIPSTAVDPTPPQWTATPEGDAWTPSILEGNLEEAYPETLPGNRFTVHYQPDTPAARAPNQLYALVDAVLNHVEDKLQVALEEPFDVYFAGSLFAGEDAALRGRSFSSERRNFFLFDDTGTPEERRYVIIHELTHLVAWNTIGKPSSVMLHEGLAVYTGSEALEAGGFIPLSDFCAAYYQADQLPQLGGTRPYLGHIRDLDLYFASGCFVEYLIRTRGLHKFEEVFTTGDYPGIYGRTLSQLEATWIATLKPVARNLDFEPSDLITSVNAVADAYDRLLQDMSGTPAQLAAYRELDQARIAALQARFDEAEEHLTEFDALLAGE